MCILWGGGRGRGREGEGIVRGVFFVFFLRSCMYMCGGHDSMCIVEEAIFRSFSSLAFYKTCYW